MEVHFGGFYGKKRNDNEKLQRILIQKDFVWEDIEGKITAIYTCNEGIVLDICTKTSMDDIYRFIEKWPQVRDSSHISHEEYEKIENDNPMRTDFHVRLTVNGIKLLNQQGSGLCWYPETFEERKVNPIAEELMKEYKCDEHYAWFFRRISYQWEEVLNPSEIALTFEATKVSVSGEHFTTKSCFEEHEVSFHNPINGEEYILQLHTCKVGALDNLPDMKEYKELEFPTHYYELIYSVKSDCDINELDFRLTDCNQGDQARKSYVTNSTRKAASVAMIGGADGPTSVFIAGKLKGSEEQKYSAFSSMYFEIPEEIEWRPIFQMERRKNMELVIKL